MGLNLLQLQILISINMEDDVFTNTINLLIHGSNNSIKTKLYGVSFCSCNCIKIKLKNKSTAMIF